MRIDLNLSKDPFRNRAVFWLTVGASYVLVLIALVVVLARAGAVGADAVALKDEAAEQATTIAQLEATIAAMKAAESNALFTDADRRALDEARMLLERKAVGWSRLLGDLEPYVPERSRLTGIEIVGFEGTGSGLVVRLRLTGTGKDIDQMTTFLARLDGSGGKFASDPIENGPIPDTGEFAFTIDIRYRPVVTTEPASVAVGERGERTDG